MKIVTVRFECSAVSPHQYPTDQLPEIAFLGRSNVGKSSLINSLLKMRGVARTSSTPGRTQQVNFFCINEIFHFVDLPGYGYARVPKQIRDQWAPMVETYLNNRPQLGLAILIVDIRHNPLPLDEQMQDWLKNNNLDYYVIATKADKLSNNKLTVQLKSLREIFGPQVIPFSAVTRSGSDLIWRAIHTHLKERNR